MKTYLFAFVVLGLGLSACGAPSTSTLQPTLFPTAASLYTKHPPGIPTPTSIPLVRPPASPTPLLFTDPSTQLSERIVSYYFVTSLESPAPKGSVAISTAYILAPTYSDATYGPDTIADLRTALQAVLRDSRNGWISNELEIGAITFDNGHANVVLQGKYFGVGDVTLIAAEMQILMTVFANPSVQTATITLNGDTIGNLGISNSMNAKPAAHVFTRTEIETFINDQAYVSP